jgi:hypothetical protein
MLSSGFWLKPVQWHCQSVHTELLNTAAHPKTVEEGPPTAAPPEVLAEMEECARCVARKIVVEMEVC